jgi:hypothetical protein
MSVVVVKAFNPFTPVEGIVSASKLPPFEPRYPIKTVSFAS